MEPWKWQQLLCTAGFRCIIYIPLPLNREPAMRALMISIVLVATTSLCGCSKDAPPAATNTPAVPNGAPGCDPDNAFQFTEEAAPDFDPKLTLVWPGTPEESRRRINAGQADETTIYIASFWQIQTGQLNMFGATVYEFSEKDLQGFDSKELLAGHGTSGSEVELTRKEIEHGPNKHLGLDLTSKDDGGFYRRVNVMVGRRIYSVKFSSRKQEGLTAADVLKFFESFAITEI